jgi:hypothetical protein
MAAQPAQPRAIDVGFDESPELDIGYVYPTIEGWQDGDRTITCYATRVDGAR